MTATKTYRPVSLSVERVYDEDKIKCATKNKGLDAIKNVFYKCSKIWQTEQLCHAFIFNSEVNFVTPPKGKVSADFEEFVRSDCPPLFIFGKSAFFPFCHALKISQHGYAWI